MAGRETRIPKGLVPHRRSGIHRGFSYIAHNRRNVRFKGLWRDTHHPIPEPRTQRLTGRNRGVFTARDIGRVDRVNSLDTLCIVTFGTAQLNEPLAVAAAHHGRDANFA